MPDTPTPLTPDTPPPIPLGHLLPTLGSPARWAILRELADGSSLMTSELAKRTGGTPSATSKQLGGLIAAGIVQNPRGRLYEIKPQFIADKTERTLDFGWCLLRLKTHA